MTPSQVQAMIHASINANNNKSQFGVSAVQHHTHNSVDSPKVSYNNLSNLPTLATLSLFAGFINSDGTNVFLPTGWSSSKDAGSGTGYTITHNLGTTNYSVVLTGYQSGFTEPWIAQLTSVTSTAFGYTMANTDVVIQNAAASFILYVQK